MPESNPFDLPSGSYGPPRPYTFDILTSRWIIDPTDENNPDVVKIRFDGTTDDPDWQDWQLDLRVDRNVWEIIDDGDTIIHQNPKVKSPTRRTQFGKFVLSVSKREELAGLREVILERGKDKDENIWRDSTIWRGLRLAIGERPAIFTNPDTGEQQEYFEPIVIGYEGELDSDTMNKLDQERLAAREQLEEELAKIAKDYDKHADFANHVMSEMNLSDQELITDVMTPGKEGFWGRNRK